MRACSLGPAGKVSFLFAAALTVLGATGASTGVGEQQSGCEPYDSTWIGELSEYQALASDTDSITAVGRTPFSSAATPEGFSLARERLRDMHASSSGVRTESRRSGYDNTSPGHSCSIRICAIRRRRPASDGWGIHNRYGL